MRKNRSFVAALALVLLSAPAAVAASSATPIVGSATPVAAVDIGSLKQIGVQTVPSDLSVDGALVGGLSGISYDPSNNLYYVISDDKSVKAPARFYTASLDFNNLSLSPVTIDYAVTLLQRDGSPYPSADAGGDVPDPESIRVDPQTGNLWWTSEGSLKLDLSPFVKSTSPDGAYVSTLKTPAMFTMDPEQKTGPRDNLSFEGLSLSPNGDSIWIGMETALNQDGPVATTDSGTMSRLTNLDRAGNVIAQYAYPIDPIQAVPTGPAADNGVSEILDIDSTHLLVLERSGVSQSDGSYIDYIRLYEVDFTNATNLKDIDALQGATYTAGAKRLILDFSQLGMSWVDNLEGMTWGPTLPNGDRSLIFVSDNNFNSDTQVTQFWAFDAQP